MTRPYGFWNQVLMPDGRSQEQFLREEAENHTLGELAAQVKGRSEHAIRQKLDHLGLRAKMPALPEAVAAGQAKETIADVNTQKFLAAIKDKPKSRKELSQEFDRSEETIETIVAGLQALSYEIIRTENETVLWPTRSTAAVPPPPTLWDEEYGHFLIGVISDLHGGSKWSQWTNLRRCVQEMYEAGVRDILVPGDITAGLNVYRGQIHDLVTTSGPEQTSIVCEYLPQCPDLEYEMIGGNHDASFIKQNGFNPVDALAKARDDVVYAGFDLADVPITPQIDARLWHPMGGIPYAYCLSSDSEILTRRGWATYTDISLSDEVATLNPQTHAIEYQRPEELFIQKHSGKLVHFSGSTFDLLVTPDHDLYINDAGDRKQHGWRKVPARHVADGWSRQRHMFFQSGTWEGEEPETFTIPSDGEWSGKRHLGTVPIEPWLRFLGWWISEGHTIRGKAIEFTQNEGPNLEEIKEACREIGFEPREYAHSRKVKRVRVHNAELCRWLEKHCGRGAANKKAPRFIMELCPRLIDIFLDALFKGDGSFRNGQMGTYTSKSEQLLDDVQELLLKAGLVGVKRGNPGQDRPRAIGVQQQSSTPAILTQPTEMVYEGTVWCVKVPNGLILARRNGKPVWTGNSYRMQKAVEQMAFAELLKVIDRKKSPRLRMLFAGHLHIWLDFHAGPILCLQIPCFEGQTPYLKRKGGVPEIGGVILEFELTAGGVIRRHIPQELRFDEIDNDYLNYPVPVKEEVKLEPLFQWAPEEQAA